MAWVDRPQGLLVLFRLAGLSGSSEALRVMAILAAVVTLVAVAAAAWAVAGRGPAVAAAGLYAVLSPAPHLEGFTANGELLSGAFAAAAVACALWWTIRRDWWLLVAAALLAGSAPLVKQSAIDGIVVVGAAALLIADRRWRNVAIAVVAGAIPGLIAVVHAATATAGLSDWWYAIVGYRSETESVVSGDIGSRFRLLVDSVPPALQDLLPILVLALLGLRRGRPGPALLAIWLAAGIVGFLGGGLYHPHYWIQLVPVLSVLAGIGLVRLLHLPLAVKLAFALYAGAGRRLLGGGLHDHEPDPHLGADERRLAAGDRTRRRASAGLRDAPGRAGLRRSGRMPRCTGTRTGRRPSATSGTSTCSGSRVPPRT